MCALTDGLAGLLLGCMPRNELEGLVRELSEMSLPEAVEVSVGLGHTSQDMRSRMCSEE